jgi:hypothetical protein
MTRFWNRCAAWLLLVAGAEPRRSCLVAGPSHAVQVDVPVAHAGHDHAAMLGDPAAIYFVCGQLYGTGLEIDQLLSGRSG